MQLTNPGVLLPPTEQLERLKLLVDTTYLPLADIYILMGETHKSGTALYRANYSAYQRKERTADLMRRHSTGRRNPNKRYTGRGEMSQATADYIKRFF